MAVLSDQEIWNLLDSGRLVIDPLPDIKAGSPSAIDLTLASDFIVPESPGGDAVRTAIDTRDSNRVMQAITALSQEGTASESAPLELRPGMFVLAWTRERIQLPNFLSARVEGRSTLARVGLSIHQSAPTVHATFSGRLQLEMTNAGPFTLELYPGQRVCQLIIETMSLPAAGILQSVHQAQG